MNPYAYIRKCGVALGFACGVGLANAVRGLLASINTHFGVIVVIDIVVISLSALVIQSITIYAFSRLSIIRKIILNGEYIEGVWIDLVLRGGNVVACGVVQFEPAGDSVRYCGSNYTIGGHFVSSFRSEIIHIDWPIIKFKFRGVDRSNDNVFPEGFGELQLTKHSRIAGQFTGYSISTRKSEKLVLVGWRLENEKWVLLKTADERRDLFKEYIEMQGYSEGRREAL